MNEQSRPRPSRRQNAGFTLIEVLVAIVVLAIGILGVAALQTTSISQGKGSLQSVQANALAMDLADRIRVNADAAYLAKYKFDTTQGNSSAHSDPGCYTSSGTIKSCTSDQIAQQDINDWYNLVVAQLPNPTVKVACDDGSCTANPQTMSVTIYWNENKDKNLSAAKNEDKNCGTTAYDPSQDLPCVTLSFQP